MAQRYTLTIEVETIREARNFEETAAEYIRALNQFDPHARMWKGDPFIVAGPSDDEPMAGRKAGG